MGRRTAQSPRELGRREKTRSAPWRRGPHTARRGPLAGTRAAGSRVRVRGSRQPLRPLESSRLHPGPFDAEEERRARPGRGQRAWACGGGRGAALPPPLGLAERSTGWPQGPPRWRVSHGLGHCPCRRGSTGVPGARDRRGCPAPRTLPRIPSQHSKLCASGSASRGPPSASSRPTPGPSLLPSLAKRDGQPRGSERVMRALGPKALAGPAPLAQLHSAAERGGCPFGSQLAGCRVPREGELPVQAKTRSDS